MIHEKKLFINKELDDYCLNILKIQKYLPRISWGLPQNIRIFPHKTGTYVYDNVSDNKRHVSRYDIGIIYTDNLQNGYIVCIMTHSSEVTANQPQDNYLINTVDPLLSKISSTIYNSIYANL
jgi:hypothetical protein